jgi:hypothetical protein
MFRPIAPLAMLACACAMAAPALAHGRAAEAPDVAGSEAQPVSTGTTLGIARASSTPKLWATVNICDTQAAPNSMGVRAGMPGNASRERTFMRFRAEYWNPSIQSWAPVADRGVSGWLYAGPARYERRQAGWTFEFAAPPAGETFTVRGVVEFQWRKRLGPRPSKRVGSQSRGKGSQSRVVRSVTRVTETGISGVHGGDPAGTSKAMCLIY